MSLSPVNPQLLAHCRALVPEQLCSRHIYLRSKLHNGILYYYIPSRMVGIYLKWGVSTMEILSCSRWLETGLYTRNYWQLFSILQHIGTIRCIPLKLLPQYYISNSRDSEILMNTYACQINQAVTASLSSSYSCWLDISHADFATEANEMTHTGE